MKEKPKLTKGERKFCELLRSENMYIARDEYDDELWLFYGEPMKETRIGESVWWVPKKDVCQENISLGATLSFMADDVMFDFIQSSDEKPWSVADLLQLEVKDE